MAADITKRDVLWGYIAQILNIGAGLILLPVILHYLSTEEIGLWFVFITLAGFAQLLEFGFNPTIARNTAYIYSGAQNLVSQGLPDISNPREKINHKLLWNLVYASKYIYKIIAILAVFLLCGGGTFYIATLISANLDFLKILIAWFLFSLGYIATFYYGYVTGFLQGSGNITMANKVTVLTKTALIVLGTLAVSTGFGLLGLGIASLIACLCGRFLALRFFKSAISLEGAIPDGCAKSERKKLFEVLWFNTSRLGAVQVGAFLIQRANILIASSYLGLASSASYSMTVTILMALSSISMVICQIQLPRMNTLQFQGGRQQLAEVYGQMLIVSWTLFICGLFFIVFFGSSLLDLISSKAQIISTPVLLLLGVVLLLELNHSIAASYLTTINKIPFVSAALWSGAGIIVFSILLVKPFGVLGLVVAQGAVQLVYNNWKWPMEVYKDLQAGSINLVVLGASRFAKQHKRKK